MNTWLTSFAAALALVAVDAVAANAGPTDAEIAHIVVTANQVDIDAGKLAQSRGHSEQVKDFGERMVTDHTAVNKSAETLATSLHLAPEPNATSTSLQQGGEENLAALKKLNGAAFDKAYIEHEVAYHQKVLDALDNTLIPSAQNAQLKALLVKTRPAFVDHLEHARQLQASLGKASESDKAY